MRGRETKNAIFPVPTMCNCSLGAHQTFTIYDPPQHSMTRSVKMLKIISNLSVDDAHRIRFGKRVHHPETPAFIFENHIHDFITVSLHIKTSIIIMIMIVGP